MDALGDRGFRSVGSCDEKVRVVATYMWNFQNNEPSKPNTALEAILRRCFGVKDEVRNAIVEPGQ